MKVFIYGMNIELLEKKFQCAKKQNYAEQTPNISEKNK